MNSKISISILICLFPVFVFSAFEEKQKGKENKKKKQLTGKAKENSNPPAPSNENENANLNKTKNKDSASDTTLDSFEEENTSKNKKEIAKKRKIEVCSVSHEVLVLWAHLKVFGSVFNCPYCISALSYILYPSLFMNIRRIETYISLFRLFLLTLLSRCVLGSRLPGY